MASNQQDSEKIGMLVAMGFEASSAATALDLCGGHLEQAANHLLMGGTTGPSGDSTAAAFSSSAAAFASSDAGGRGGGGEDDIRLVNAPISQYSVDNGRSACTCIALYAGQDFLKQHQHQQQQQTSIVTAEFLQNAILQGVEIYNGMRSVDPTVEHKSAEEVLQTTSAFSSLRMPDSIQQGMLVSRSSSISSSTVNDDHHPQSLQGLLAASQDATEWTCVLITKTPETVLVCLPPLSPNSAATNTTTCSSDASMYILIDSHPRPQQFPGATEAYARLHSSLQSLVTSSLQVLFPYTDLGPDVPELMAAMYNQFDLYRFRYQQPPSTTIS